MYAHLCAYGWLGLCVFKCVCVFFCARAVFWTAYVIPCCHGEGPSADSTPPCLFYQKFHACIWAARWQRVSISSSEQKLLTSLQIGKLELSLQLSRMTILCFMKAFWKLSFLYFVIVKCRRAASRCKNFWNTTFEILLFLFTPSQHQFWWIGTPHLWGVREALFSPLRAAYYGREDRG